MTALWKLRRSDEQIGGRQVGAEPALSK